MYWNSVCQICLPHGDLGILCSLYPLQLFCLYITLQHHMTCTNSHCSFNITCVLILDLVQPYFWIDPRLDGNMYIVAVFSVYTHTHTPVFWDCVEQQETFSPRGILSQWLAAQFQHLKQQQQIVIQSGCLQICHCKMLSFFSFFFFVFCFFCFLSFYILDKIFGYLVAVSLQATVSPFLASFTQTSPFAWNHYHNALVTNKITMYSALWLPLLH